MVDLLPLRRPHEDAGLAGLFGQAVVDVGDDGEGGALWVADANIDPVISRTQQKAQCRHSTGFISGPHSHCNSICSGQQHILCEWSRTNR